MKFLANKSRAIFLDIDAAQVCEARKYRNNRKLFASNFQTPRAFSNNNISREIYILAAHFHPGNSVPILKLS